MTQADRVHSTPPTNTPVDTTRRRFLAVAAFASVAGAGSLAAAAMTPNDVPQAVTVPRHSRPDAEMTAAVTEIAIIDDTINAMHKKYGDDADSQDDYIDFADRRLDLLEMMGSTPSMSRIGIEAKAAALLMNELACDYSRFGDVAESLALDILALAKAVTS